MAKPPGIGLFIAGPETEIDMASGVEIAKELHSSYSDVSEALHAPKAHFHYRSRETQKLTRQHLCMFCIHYRVQFKKELECAARTADNHTPGSI